MAFPPLPQVVHPVLVHFTIGLVPAAAAFATLHAWRRASWSLPAALALAGAAALLTVFTVLTGFGDYNEVAPALEGTPTRDLLEWHERLGVATGVVVVATAALGIWRRRALRAGGWLAWAFALGLLLATALIGLTGWFGGSLVYDHGVNVAAASAP